MLKFIFLLLLPLLAFGQASSPNDTFKIGVGSTSSDKGFIFDTNDGVSNKKLTVEKTTKMLKFDGNTFRLGDGSAVNSKVVLFNGDGKSLTYNGSTNEFSYDGDTVSFGDGTNTSKVLKFNKGASSPVIRYNSVSGKLEFSHDGTTFKEIGSGSGSGGSDGINLIANTGFEDGLTGWTNSGGTFTQESYSTPETNNLRFARLVASGSGQFVQTDLIAIPSTIGAGCMADIKYKTTTANAFKVVALDASSNVLATQTLAAYSGQGLIGSPIIVFPCPATAATVRLRIESLLAGTIDFDNAYLGGNKNLVQVSQALLAGESFFQASASSDCTRTSTTIGVFSCGTGLPGPTIVTSSLGEWQTTDANLLRQTINNLPPGNYKATFYILGAMSVNAQAAFAITDGATTCESGPGNSAASFNHPFAVSCTFSYPSSGNRSFELVGGVSSGQLVVYNSYVSPRASTKFQLDYSPSSAQTALTSTAAEFLIDVNIGGANVNLGSGDEASYTVTGSTGALDMVINRGSAGIACESPAVSNVGALTCDGVGGLETLGLTFNIPEAGDYRVCTSFTVFTQTGAGGNIAQTFQLVETPSNSYTILQEGKEKTYHATSTESSSISRNIRNCGIFNFSSATQKTVRLLYEQDITATITTPLIFADRSAVVGQRDVHFTVEKISNNVARPVLTGDQMVSPGLVKPIVRTFDFLSCNTTSTVAFRHGQPSWVTPGTGSGAGICTFNHSGVFSGAPTCVCNAANGGLRTCSLNGYPSASQILIQVRDNSTNTLSDQNGTVMCFGLAP